MINVAVIGAGAISDFHIEGYLAFPDRCRIVAVADIDVAKARRQIARYRLEAVAADDIGALLTGPGIDLASVCTPPGTHAEIAGRLLRFGSGALGQITSSVVHHGQDQQLVFQAERAKIAMPWTVSASAQQPNGFPQRDEVTIRTLSDFYHRLPDLAHEGHTGQIGDVLTAMETPGARVLIDGHEGRKTLEIITAIYQAAITGGRVALPLPADDPFRTRDGLLAAAPRFHEKKVSVAGFAANEITTTVR
jgi:predicted dehydrogenase